MVNATEISRWFAAGCDYDAGVVLYDAVGSNTFLKIVFKKGHTAHNAQRLQQELKTIAQQLTQHVAEQVVVTTQPLRSEQDNPLNGIDINALSPKFRERVFVLRPKYYREAANLHTRLFDATDAERQTMVPEMMKLMYANAAIWRDIEYYLRTGLEPKDEQESPGEVVLSDLSYQQLYSLIGSLASKISRWRNKVKKMPEGDERTELMERIEKENTVLQAARKMYKQ